MHFSHRLLRGVGTALVLMGAASISPSEVVVPVPGGPGINPESMYGKESAQGVYVRDSAVALEKFAQAQRMERLKEWAKAADLYQEVLEKFSDRVVPSQVDKDNNIYQYTSVIAAVQQKMSRWPTDGLEVYRSRFEAAASSMLESARADDRAAMQAILSRYFATDTAKVAGLRLMDLYFEAGEFPASAWLGELLLAQHPNLLVERPRIIYRVALANHMVGDDEKAKAALAELQSKYPNETATIRGVDTKLVESLTIELAQPASRAQLAANSSWPMFGGSPSHARLSTAAGRPGAKLYQIKLSEPTYNGMQADQKMTLKQKDVADQNSGASLVVMPVVDRGELFFQDGVKVYAVNIETGSPLPGWLQSYPGERKGQYQLSGMRSPPRGPMQTITVTDSSVIAVMGQTDRAMMMYGGGSSGEAKLVCLDRTTGHENWVLQPRNLPEEAGTLKNAELNGSPLVVDQNVYVTARSAKGAQFEDCFVICLDLKTGKYKWNCYVASANSVANAMMMDDGTPSASETSPQLAFANGRLFVMTNLGALAAIDGYGGRIVWLSIYQRDQSAAQAMANPWQMRMNPALSGLTAEKPWMNNPVFVDNGKVFVLPSDGKFLEIYDAGTGVEVKRLDPKHLTPPPQMGETAAAADTLIAVNGPNLLVTAPNSAMYINWEKYNRETYNKRNDPAIVWPTHFASSVRGRAFVANNRIVVPTQKKLLPISLKGGRVLEEYPKYPKEWDSDENEGPGNVIVSDEHVIVAAHRRIDVYTNMDAAKQKLDTEIANSPNAPEPRLRYAEVMFVAGDITTALQKLDNAIELIGGRDKMTPGAARDRVYKDSIEFAQKLGKDVKDPNADSLPAVQSLYDRAAAAAYSPAQQVNYRVMRAKLAVVTRDYPLAVKLFQQIIANEEWRKVPVADEVSTAQTPAAVFARTAIDGLIRTAGPICYAQFEQEAIQQFNAAKAAGQPDALMNVATQYPNSKSAPEALLTAADLKDVGGDHRGAVQLLRQIYLNYAGTADKRRVLESMARNYLLIPNRTSVAVARLADAAKLAGDSPLAQPITLPGGQTLADVPLAQALTELKKARGQEIAKSLPDFKLPIPNFDRLPTGKKKLRVPFAPETPESVISGVQALIVPARAYQRPDRVATYSPVNGLCLYAVGSTKPLATWASTDPPGLAWGPQGPVAWSAGQLTMFRDDSSDNAWSFDLKNAPPAEAIAAGLEDNTEAKAADDDGDAQIINGNMQGRVMINGNRRIIIRNGVVRQMAIRPGGQVPQVVGVGTRGEVIAEARPIGDAVLVATTTGRLVMLDAADGHVRWQARVSDRPVDRLVADEDFLVITQRDEAVVTLTVLDAFTGQSIGRRTFDDESRVPTNIALSQDGTLVYTVPDRIVIKNLYEPWNTPEREIVDQRAQNTGQFPYIASPGTDQLQVVDGRILVLAEQGTSLRVFSLETGKPLRYKPVGSSNTIDLVLQTGNQQPGNPVSLRVVGTQVYLIGRQSLIAYNIDHPEQSWRSMPPTGSEQTVDTFIGRNHLVLLQDTQKKVNAGKAASFWLTAHARYGSSDAEPDESGVRTYNTLVSDPSGILTWQAVEGGFYYLAADQKLHFLKGMGN